MPRLLSPLCAEPPPTYSLPPSLYPYLPFRALQFIISLWPQHATRRAVQAQAIRSAHLVQQMYRSHMLNFHSMHRSFRRAVRTRCFFWCKLYLLVLGGKDVCEVNGVGVRLLGFLSPLFLHFHPLPRPLFSALPFAFPPSLSPEILMQHQDLDLAFLSVPLSCWRHCASSDSISSAPLRDSAS